MAIASLPRTEDALLSFLPLIYVIWSDGSVSPTEIEELARRVRTHEDLETADRAMLLDWLDPAHPPRVGQLQLILLTIRQACQGLPFDDRRGLAELGLQMARRSQCPSERTVAAVRDLEQALWISGTELARELVGATAPAPAHPPGHLDRQGLTRYLDGDYAAVRQQVRGWLEEPRFSRQPGLDLATYRERIWSWCQELAQRGLTRRGLPKDLGGDGDSGSLLAGFQQLAQFDVSLIIKLGVQVGLFGGSILNLGTERHRPLARQAFDLELPGCFAMTERDHGSNVKDLRTTARFDASSDQFVIHTPDDGARKEWIGNAGRHARMATVFAQLEIDGQGFGVHAFLVPIRDLHHTPMPGVRIEDCGHKLGLNGVDNGKLWFDQVRIPRDNLLDRFAQVSREGVYTSSIQSATKRFFTMIGTLVMGRVSLAGASISAAKVGVALAVEYGSRRRQFGPAGAEEMEILDYQAHQRRLMPALATCFALDFASQHLMRRWLATPATEEEARELEVLGAGLKATASWEAMRMLQTCRECCGGNGYLWANRFADLKADLDVFTTFEGDNTVLMQLVARGLLTGYRQQFSDLKFSAVLKYLVEQAGRVLKERNPVSARSTDKLRDAAHLRGLFKAREDQLLVSVARRLKSKIDKGTDSYLAFNECQDHLLSLGRAYVERVVVERFQTAVEEAPEQLRPVLKDLCDLYALHRLYEDRAWFLEHGMFEPVKSKAVREQVLELCATVRESSVDLVRSFGIPAALLDVPMLA